MKFLTVFLLYMLSIINADITVEDAKKMSIKELRKSLDEIGLQCKGCSEKDDYVKLYVENQHLPKKENKDTSTQKTSNKNNEDVEKKVKQKELDDLMDKLKKSGFGGAKMYTKDDIEKMTKETNQPSKKKSKKVEKTEDTIEL